MASSEFTLNKKANSAANSWLLPIEQRISSVQKVNAELKRSADELELSNRELSRKLLQLRRKNAARRRNRGSDPPSPAPALV